MRLNVELKNELYEEYTAIAAEEGKSISALTRELIVNRIKKQRREEARILAGRTEDEDG
jgi:hypothetical protein